MAIRTVEFSVTQGGIVPAVKQFGGVQGEHRSTKAVFKLDSELYSAIVQQADDASGSAVYRIDGYDGEGGVSRSETSPLTGGEVSYYLEEWITRYGGTVKAVLVVSVLKDDTTEMELYSFPALLQLKNLPAGTDTSGESYESMSTLSQAAKDAAERASQSAQAAEDAQNATELARFALENGSTVIFDGNGTFGLADPVFVVDETLSVSSGNAVANKTVTAKFNSLEEDLSSQISEVEENADTEIAKCELKSNKTDVFPEGITETILKSQYPSMKLINDMVRVVETGTSGIWTYRKWSDGTAECWGKTSAASIPSTDSEWTTWSGIRWNTAAAAENYPYAINFISAPIVIVDVEAGNFPGWYYHSYNNSTSNTGSVQIACIQIPPGGITVSVHFYAIGKWEQEG